MTSDIDCTDGGPYLVTGPAVITAKGDIDRIEVPDGKRVALCACGRSKTKPMCDGSHRTPVPAE